MVDWFGRRRREKQISELSDRVRCLESVSFAESMESVFDALPPHMQKRMAETPEMGLPALDRRLDLLEHRVGDLLYALDQAGVVHFQQAGFKAGPRAGRRLTAMEAQSDAEAEVPG